MLIVRNYIFPNLSFPVCSIVSEQRALVDTRPFGTSLWLHSSGITVWHKVYYCMRIRWIWLSSLLVFIVPLWVSCLTWWPCKSLTRKIDKVDWWRPIQTVCVAMSSLFIEAISTKMFDGHSMDHKNPICMIWLGCVSVVTSSLKTDDRYEASFWGKKSSSYAFPVIPFVP